MNHSVVFFLWSATAESVLYGLMMAAVLFSVAYVGVRIASKTVRRLAERRFESEAVVSLLVNLSRVSMWFVISLVALSFLGFSGIASSLGTATGFVALGVAYALKDVLADTVAGVYLVRDQDFEVGDRVEVDSATGEIKQIDLRKTRLQLENGNRRVINNSDVEKKWTKLN